MRSEKRRRARGSSCMRAGGGQVVGCAAWGQGRRDREGEAEAAERERRREEGSRCRGLESGGACCLYQGDEGGLRQVPDRSGVVVGDRLGNRRGGESGRELWSGRVNGNEVDWQYCRRRGLAAGEPTARSVTVEDRAWAWAGRRSQWCGAGSRVGWASRGRGRGWPNTGRGGTMSGSRAGLVSLWLLLVLLLLLSSCGGNPDGR